MPKTIEEKESPAERAFISLWQNFNMLPIEDVHSQPTREFQFDPSRKWRFDFAWPMQKVAVEIEGGTWMKRGGHTTGTGYEKNCEKYNRAAELGWRVLRYTPDMFKRDPVSVIKQIEGTIRS